MSRVLEKTILGLVLIAIIGVSSALVTAFVNRDQNNVAPLIKNLESNKVSQEEIDDVEDEQEDVPITGNALERASNAALNYIGEGRVTDTEVGDEEGYYEIEITLSNGKEVDVHLDENFNVLSVEGEDENDDE